MVMTAAMKLKDAPWKESYDKPRQCIKKQRHYFADKGLSNQSYDFSSMDVKVEPERRLSTKELMLSKCGAGEDLRVPWMARKSTQSILKEINPE